MKLGQGWVGVDEDEDEDDGEGKAGQPNSACLANLDASLSKRAVHLQGPLVGATSGANCMLTQLHNLPQGEAATMQPKEAGTKRRAVNAAVLASLIRVTEDLNQTQAEFEYRKILKQQGSSKLLTDHELDMEVLDELRRGVLPARLQGMLASDMWDMQRVQASQALHPSTGEQPSTAEPAAIPAVLANKQSSQRWGYFESMPWLMPEEDVAPVLMLRKELAPIIRKQRPKPFKRHIKADTWQSMMLQRKRESYMEYLGSMVKAKLGGIYAVHAARMIQRAWRKRHPRGYLGAEPPAPAVPPAPLPSSMSMRRPQPPAPAPAPDAAPPAAEGPQEAPQQGEPAAAAPAAMAVTPADVMDEEAATCDDTDVKKSLCKPQSSMKRLVLPLDLAAVSGFGSTMPTARSTVQSARVVVVSPAAAAAAAAAQASQAEAKSPAKKRSKKKPATKGPAQDAKPAKGALSVRIQEPHGAEQQQKQHAEDVEDEEEATELRLGVGQQGKDEDMSLEGTGPPGAAAPDLQCLEPEDACLHAPSLQAQAQAQGQGQGQALALLSPACDAQKVSDAAASVLLAAEERAPDLVCDAGASSSTDEGTALDSNEAGEQYEQQGQQEQGQQQGQQDQGQQQGQQEQGQQQGQQEQGQQQGQQEQGQQQGQQERQLQGKGRQQQEQEEMTKGAVVQPAAEAAGAGAAAPQAAALKHVRPRPSGARARKAAPPPQPPPPTAAAAAAAGHRRARGDAHEAAGAVHEGKEGAAATCSKGSTAGLESRPQRPHLHTRQEEPISPSETGFNASAKPGAKGHASSHTPAMNVAPPAVPLPAPKQPQMGVRHNAPTGATAPPQPSPQAWLQAMLAVLASPQPPGPAAAGLQPAQPAQPQAALAKLSAWSVNLNLNQRRSLRPAAMLKQGLLRRLDHLVASQLGGSDGSCGLAIKPSVPAVLLALRQLRPNRLESVRARFAAKHSAGTELGRSGQKPGGAPGGSTKQDEPYIMSESAMRQVLYPQPKMRVRIPALVRAAAGKTRVRSQLHAQLRAKVRRQRQGPQPPDERATAGVLDPGSRERDAPDVPRHGPRVSSAEQSAAPVVKPPQRAAPQPRHVRSRSPSPVPRPEEGGRVAVCMLQLGLERRQPEGWRERMLSPQRAAAGSPPKHGGAPGQPWCAGQAQGPRPQARLSSGPVLGFEAETPQSGCGRGSSSHGGGGAASRLWLAPHGSEQQRLHEDGRSPSPSSAGSWAGHHAPSPKPPRQPQLPARAAAASHPTTPELQLPPPPKFTSTPACHVPAITHPHPPTAASAMTCATSHGQNSTPPASMHLPDPATPALGSPNRLPPSHPASASYLHAAPSVASGPQPCLAPPQTGRPLRCSLSISHEELHIPAPPSHPLHGSPHAPLHQPAAGGLADVAYPVAWPDPSLPPPSAAQWPEGPRGGGGGALAGQLAEPRLGQWACRRSGAAQLGGEEHGVLEHLHIPAHAEAHWAGGLGPWAQQQQQQQQQRSQGGYFQAASPEPAEASWRGRALRSTPPLHARRRSFTKCSSPQPDLSVGGWHVEVWSPGDQGGMGRVRAPSPEAGALHPTARVSLDAGVAVELSSRRRASIEAFDPTFPRGAAVPRTLRRASHDSIASFWPSPPGHLSSSGEGGRRKS